MLQTRGFSGATVGYHVNCGSSLINTWNNPSQTCAGIPSTPSIFTTALSNNDWTAMSAQPFPGSGSTLGTDTDVIQNLHTLMQQRPANAQSPLFIYAPHPYISQALSYEELWTTTAPDTGDSQPTTASREYFHRLYHRLEPILGKDNLSMIPTGEVLHELDVRMKRGEIPGYTNAYQLYSDDIHLGNAGDYILGVTTMAAYTGQDPWGMASPGQYGSTGLSTAQSNAIHDAIWTVLCRDPNARPIWHSASWPYKVHRIGHLHEQVVRTNGTLIEAVNLGSTANVTVNGVTFQGSLTRDGLTASHNETTVFSDGGVSPEFETLMDSFAYVAGTGSTGDANLVLKNLEPGKRYEVQLFVSDQRNAITRSRRQQFILGADAPYPAQEGLGFSVTGAFIATDATQTLTIRAFAGTGDSVDASPMLNAFQVRQVDALSSELIPTHRTWTGAGTGDQWNTASNWQEGSSPANGQTVVFNQNSTSQLTNQLTQALTVGGIQLTNPSGPVTITGNSLSVDYDGIDLSQATQNLTIQNPLSLASSQTWEVANGRTLTLGSAPGAQTIVPNGNTLSIQGAGNVILNYAALQQSSALSKAGTGTLTIGSSLNLLNNEVRVFGGTLDASSGRLFSNTTHVSSGGLKLYGGTLVISDWNYSSGSLGFLRANTDAVTIDGGAIRLSTTSNYSRGFIIGSKGATLEAASGSLWTVAFHANAPVTNSGNGPLILTGAGDGVFDKVFPGNTSASLTKTGNGTWTLTQANTAAGPIHVNAGTLRVNGSLANGAVTVASGATLGGTGTIQGASTVFGTLAPGATTGTLVFGSNLSLNTSAILAADIGTATDLVTVAGNLTLDGTLQITPASGYGTGVYELIRYTGTLSNQGLVVSAPPAATPFVKIDTTVAGKVRLLAADTAFGLWQLDNFGDTTHPDAIATADPDHDGSTNEAEFLAGTSPKQSADVLRINAVSHTDGEHTITWQAIPGKTYRVQYNETLIAPWLDTLPGSLITATAGQTILSYTDQTSAGFLRRFYRVSVVP